MPLILHDRVIGVMDLESERPSFFTDDHVRALSLLAPQIATSVENARLYGELAQREQRMEQDLHAAFKLQSVLVPRTISDVEGVEVGIKTRPARQISGDFYDFFEHSNDYALIAFGDVSGKGAAAALYAALISGLLRILGAAPPQPFRTDESVERSAARTQSGRAVRHAVAHYLGRQNADVYSVVSAGTLPPMLYRKRRNYRSSKRKACPLACWKISNTIRSRLRLKPNDFMLLYSDGVEDQLGKDAASLDEVTASEKDMETYGRDAFGKSIES